MVEKAQEINKSQDLSGVKVGLNDEIFQTKGTSADALKDGDIFLEVSAKRGTYPRYGIFYIILNPLSGFRDEATQKDLFFEVKKT